MGFFVLVWVPRGYSFLTILVAWSKIQSFCAWVVAWKSILVFGMRLPSRVWSTSRMLRCGIFVIVSIGEWGLFVIKESVVSQETRLPFVKFLVRTWSIFVVFIPPLPLAEKVYLIWELQLSGWRISQKARKWGALGPELLKSPEMKKAYLEPRDSIFAKISSRISL